MIIDTIITTSLKILDKIIPDPEQRERAKLELLKQEQAGEMEDIRSSLSAIIEEAKSSDPWTSRARPSFLYMCYILILSAIPMGVISAISPSTAQAIVNGFQGWLGAIPDSIIQLMGIGYLGYTGARSWDKRR